jgi:hypothetical protein
VRLNVALLTAALAAAPALAEEQRYDHRGSIGFQAVVGGEYRTAIQPTTGANNADGPLLDVELGGSIAVGYDGDELHLSARLGLLDGLPDIGVFFGFRNYFGKDQWKTFLDLDLAGHFLPHIVGGVRFGVGLQWDWSPVIGTYLTLAGQIAFGQALRFGGELLLGFQFRTYVLE